jgi:hypothetical protein
MIILLTVRSVHQEGLGLQGRGKPLSPLCSVELQVVVLAPNIPKELQVVCSVESKQGFSTEDRRSRGRPIRGLEVVAYVNT